jgi:hypothetical protein
VTNNPKMISKGCLLSGFLSSAAVFCVFGAVWLTPVRSLKPIVDAEPYIWPEGCLQRQYKLRDQISTKCFSPKYIIHDWYDRGLSRPSRTKIDDVVYYRIGDDAIKYNCLIGDNSKCYVGRVEKNFFDVSNHEKGSR